VHYRLMRRVHGTVAIRARASFMLVRALLISLLGLLLAPACQRAALAPAPPVLAASASVPAPAPAGSPLLWRAQHGASVIYLFGSVHVAEPKVYPLDPRIESAFDASDTLVLEVDLDDQNRQRAALRMLELAKLPAGETLEGQVSADTWKQLQARVQEPATLALFSRLRPWFVGITLTSQELERLGFSSELGIDEHFRRRQVERGRPIVSLETVESQLGLFSTLDRQQQEDLLRETLEEMPHYRELMTDAFVAWRGGDVAELEASLLAPLRERDPGLFAKLFSERNERMTQRLLELSAQPGTYFVVVGAGHLVGATSVVDLLARQGIVPARL
jgi:uncharacterized protein YbaP (TraB family)